jgi:hypothetical protein
MTAATPDGIAPLAAWDIAEADYPREAERAEQLRFLLGYAILAPSSHNTQPWLFRVRDEGVDLYLDRTRGLPVADPEDREITISCGAALFNLRAALVHFRHAARVQLVPDPADGNLLARVTVADGDVDEDGGRRLFPAISRRRTNRQPFDDRPFPAALVEALIAAVEGESAWLYIVDGDTRATVADLIAEGDRRQWADRRFRRELAAWTHANRSDHRDGMRGYGFGFDDLMSAAGPVIMRTFDLGKGQAARDRELATGSPLLAVLGTAEDTPVAWLAAGQALAAALLTAAVDGVDASYLNQPVQVADLRPQLGEAIGRSGFPQLVLRLGHGSSVRPEPRRPVSEVLLP